MDYEPTGEKYKASSQTRSGVRGLIGICLMTVCGNQIAYRYFGDSLLGAALLVGFALGLVFIGQTRVDALNLRVKALEERIASFRKGAS
jgi:hypothetical protein